MAQECAVIMKESTEAHLSHISTVLGGNYLTLLLSAVIFLIALYISYIMVKLAISTISSYYALLPTSKAPVKKVKKPVSATAVTDDDAVYASDADGLATNLQDSDNSRVKASIGRLKNRYAQYNTAMTDYASRVQGRAADDIIDETILSRANDDFKYNTPAVKETEDVAEAAAAAAIKAAGAATAATAAAAVVYKEN